jgi:hypothetical protein
VTVSNQNRPTVTRAHAPRQVDQARSLQDSHGDHGWRAEEHAQFLAVLGIRAPSNCLGAPRNILYCIRYSEFENVLYCILAIRNISWAPDIILGRPNRARRLLAPPGSTMIGDGHGADLPSDVDGLEGDEEESDSESLDDMYGPS